MGEKQSELKNQVLVVGTTSDYIEWIEITVPTVLTEPKVRQNAEPRPKPARKFYAPSATLTPQFRHWSSTKVFGVTLSGIACFDCESMEVSSILA